MQENDSLPIIPTIAYNVLIVPAQFLYSPTHCVLPQPPFPASHIFTLTVSYIYITIHMYTRSVYLELLFNTVDFKEILLEDYKKTKI